MTLPDQISLLNSMIKNNPDVELWEFADEVRLFDLRENTKRSRAAYNQEILTAQDWAKKHKIWSA